MPIEQIKSGITGAVSSVSDGLKNSLSFLSDLKDAGWEKVSTFVNDILGLAPLIEVTGFSMKDVVADATIPPSVTLQFVKEKEADAQAIEDMLEQNKEKDTLVLIVRSLQKSRQPSKSNEAFPLQIQRAQYEDWFAARHQPEVYESRKQ